METGIDVGTTGSYTIDTGNFYDYFYIYCGYSELLLDGKFILIDDLSI